MPDSEKPPSTPQEVTSDHLRRFNKLVDFSKAKGYSGKEELDHNPKLRQQVFDEYNKAYPNDALDINMVLPIQNEIQKYKSVAQKNIKEGKAIYDGKPEDFMKNISQVDSIYGKLTSSFKFPEAYIVDKQTGEKKKLGFANKVNMTALNSAKSVEEFFKK